MFNLSTQNPETALGQSVAARPISRIGIRAFWLLVGLELVVLFGVLIWTVVWATPAATPYASPRDLTPVQEAIWARFSGEVVDPMIEVQPGVNVRESNIRGFRLDGHTYYYYVIGGQNFDPFSLGRVNNQQIEILFRDESGSRPLIIYTINPNV